MKIVFIYLIFVLIIILVSSCTSSKLSKDVDSMSMEEKEEAMKEAMLKDPPKEMTQEEKSKEISMVASLGGANTIKTGLFEDRIHKASGNIKIIEKDGEYFAVLSEDFSTDAGPDLHLFLAQNPNPKNSEQIHSGEYVDLGSLKSTKGTQTYKIPKEMVDKFNSAVVYCKPFKVVFSISKLS